MNSKNYGSYEKLQHSVNRPLGELSDFIIDEMPRHLAEIRNNTYVDHKEHESILLTRTLSSLGKIPEFEELTSLRSKRLALLDLSMLEAALIHSGIKIPDELSQKTSEFAAKLASADVLNYEGYILDNPVDSPDARLFMPQNSEARENELFFVNTHREIELELKIVVEFILNIYERVKSGDKGSFTEWEDQFSHDAEIAAEAMKKIVNTLAEIRKLSSSSFDVLRRYYKGHPNRQTPGPSGAFSAGFQALDILLLSAEDESSDGKLKIPNQIAFPQYDDHGFVGMPQIKQACLNHELQSEFYQFIKRNSKVGANIEFIMQNLLRFRQRHRGVVKKYLPEVIKGNDQPTAHGAEFYTASQASSNSPVADLLDSRISRTKDAIEKVQANN